MTNQLHESFYSIISFIRKYIDTPTMKNLLIIITIVIIAVIAYQQFSPKQTPVSNSPTATNQTDSVATAKNTVEPAPLDKSLISAAAPDAAVYFIEPADGAVVTSPVAVKFGVRNMQIVPAGTKEEFSGHHHILINMDTLPDLTQPLPATDQLKHYGGGQTEAELELPAGTHTLQLLLGNFAHVPHEQAVLSEKITITVK